MNACCHGFVAHEVINVGLCVFAACFLNAARVVGQTVLLICSPLLVFSICTFLDATMCRILEGDR